MPGRQNHTKVSQGDIGISPQVPLNSTRMVGDADDGDRGAIGTGSIGSSSPIVPLSVVRPRPLILSSDTNSMSSFQLQRTIKSPSSPESTTPKMPPQSHSPDSLIFERNVQEDILLPQASPSIPSHIRTENHIPPVLEASSAAITDSELDPDSVEIVTHSIHHTANPSAALVEPLPSPPSCEGPEEPSSSGKVLDMNDIRRLSFISFADVVNAEHAETSDHPPSRDLCQRVVGAMVYRNRSPSPLHSPASSHALGTSPPTSISASIKGIDLSPSHAGRGTESPIFATQRPISPPNLICELNVETMGQALRRTGSGDLSASRSQVSSTVGHDDY